MSQFPLKIHPFTAGGVALAAFAFYTIKESVYNVDGGFKAIKYSRVSGIMDEVYSEGTHLAIPWIQRPIIFDIRARPRSMTSLTGSKDLQMVNVTVRILSKPDPTKLPDMYRKLGTDYDERVLPSIVNEVLKSVVAQFNASQLITQRENVSRLIRERLRVRAGYFNLIVDDVSLTNIQFGTEFASAIEAKQIAQQDAQRSAFIVEKAIQEKQSTIVKAEGEALSATMIGDAIAKNPAFIQLRKIEAAREVAQIMSKASNKVMLNSDALLLNLQDLSSTQ